MTIPSSSIRAVESDTPRVIPGLLVIIVTESVVIIVTESVVIIVTESVVTSITSEYDASMEKYIAT